MKKLLFVIFTVALLLPIASCKGETAPVTEPSELSEMIFATADKGGTMYPVGAGIAKVANQSINGIKVDIKTSSGSYENAKEINQGNIDIATIAGDTAYAAVNGSGIFNENPQENIRAIGAVYCSLSSWVALSESGLTMVDESLKGKTIVVGPAASATESTSRLILGISGVDSDNAVIQNQGLYDGANAVGDSVADVAAAFAGIPVSGQLALSEVKDITVLCMSDSVIEKVLAANPFYYKTIIPAGTYKGQTQDVATFGVKCLICVNSSMSDDMAYKLAQAMFENVEKLVDAHGSMAAMREPAFICTDLPIELHSGAAKYYAEQGF